MIKICYPIESYGITDIGLVRKQNEDVWDALPEKGIYIVADGMGGHKAGEVAAEMAVSSFLEFAEDFDNDPKTFCTEAFQMINRRIYDAGCANMEWNGMGTTLTVLLFSEQSVTLAHVGDSRAYRLRDKTLRQLSVDHTVVGRMKREGLSGEFAMMRHVLTRAIGTQAFVKTQVENFSVDALDRYLLCTDGLVNYVLDEEIQECLELDETLEVKGKAMVELAKERGGSDNITVVLLEVGE